MRGIFQLGPTRGDCNLADLEVYLEKRLGVNDAVVRKDGTIFLDFVPEELTEQEVVGLLHKLGFTVERVAQLPEDKEGSEPWGLTVASPGNLRVAPMAANVRDAELTAYDVEEQEEGEANQAKFPGHSTA